MCQRHILAMTGWHSQPVIIDGTNLPFSLGPPRPQTPAYFSHAGKVGKRALKPTV